MRTLLAVFFLPVVFSQQCVPGAAQGPCNAAGTCDVPLTLCLNNECCPFANVFTVPTTTPAPCVDKLNPKTGTSDCPNVAYLCNDPTYKKVMIDQCPKTCGYCSRTNPSGATTPSACVDKINPSTGVSDCPNIAYLCQQPAYVQLMKDQCPKTCGYCH